MRLSSSAQNDAAVGWIAGSTFAHRGVHGSGVPENSLAAARAAIAQGFGIECDIQRSKDDEPMVFHDWDLLRLLGAEAETASRTAEELMAMRYPGSDERPVTLAHLLSLVAGQVPLLIEIKSRRGYDVERSCAQVRQALAGYPGDHAVMSFDPRVSRWFSRHSPDTPRGLVVTEEHSKGPVGDIRRRLALWHGRAQFLAYDIRDLPSRFATRQRANGMPIASWTVRSPELLDRARLHADAPIAEGAGLPGKT